MRTKCTAAAILTAFVVVSAGCENESGTCSPYTIDGNVRIDEAEDAAQYKGVTHATGYLSVLCESCENVEELSCLEAVDGEAVIKDTGLASLDGLGNLRSIGGSLLIRGNQSLTNIDGLMSLASVGGAIEIVANDALEDAAGLGGLDYDGELDISENFAMECLGDLSNLTSLSSLSLSEMDDLTDLEGLEGLTHLGALAITDSAGIENLDALGNLVSLGPPDPSFMFGEHWIAGNGSLESLDGLMHLREASGDFVFIDNGALSQEEIDELLSYLESIGWDGSGTSE